MALAVEKYEAALQHLPTIPKRDVPPPSNSTALKVGSSGIEEITDEEADTILQSAEEAKSPEELERADSEDQVLELTKACHGNLAACFASLKEDKKAVDACTKGMSCGFVWKNDVESIAYPDIALEIDPSYTKALHRRATANDRIGSWSSLTSAKQGM